MNERNEEFRDREAEEYLTSARNTRLENLGDWKDRIEMADELVRGNISYRNPDGVVVTEPLQITNLADQVPRDTARLVSEVEPSYIAPITGGKDKDDLNADVRGSIASHYFELNHFDIMRPMLSMDLDISGTCFVGTYIDPQWAYPRMFRIDPRFAYPSIYNNELMDLLVVQRIKLSMARMAFPNIDWSSAFGDRLKETDFIEALNYYGPDYCATAIGKTASEGSAMHAGNIAVVDRWVHGCSGTPVGFAMLPSPTSEFRGSLDQIGGAMATKNRIVNLMTEYAHEGIYAPWEERGILNWDVDPGPKTRYHHNPNIQGDTFMRRISPAQFNGELFGVLQFLDSEQRGQMAYPAQRQGAVSQSIASASFVQSTQGQLTSLVRERQRLITEVQEYVGSTCLQMDQNHLDFEKPLGKAVGKKKTYTPGEDIAGEYRLRVEYGAGAGLDRLNTDQRLLNFYSAGMTSAELSLEQTDFVSDARNEIARRENEEISRLLLQKWLSDPSVTPDLIGLTVKLKKDKGVTLAEAWAEVQSQLAEQQAAEAEAANAEAEMGAAPGAPAPAAGEQPQPQFSLQPMNQLINRVG